MTSNQDGNLLPGPNSRISRSRVDLFLAAYDMWLDGYFLTRLVQLAKEGAITLRVMGGHDLSRCLAMQDSLYALLTLKCTDTYTNDSRIVCFDRRDQSDAWQTKALGECDIYCQPSVWQVAPGFAVLEAIAAKLPVVASKTGGLLENVVNEMSGVLAPASLTARAYVRRSKGFYPMRTCVEA